MAFKNQCFKYPESKSPTHTKKKHGDKYNSHLAALGDEDQQYICSKLKLQEGRGGSKDNAENQEDLPGCETA